MNTGESLNYIQMVTHSGVVVSAVLALLVLSSLGSWTIIFRKALHLRRAREQSAQFLETFWRSKRLDQIFAAAEKLPLSPVAQVFRAGYVELSKVTQAQPAAQSDDAAMHDQLGGFENVERALARATNSSPALSSKWITTLFAPLMVRNASLQMVCITRSRSSVRVSTCPTSCSSVSSDNRCRVSANKRAFSMATAAWSANAASKSRSRVLNNPDLMRLSA